MRRHRWTIGLFLAVLVASCIPGLAGVTDPGWIAVLTLVGMVAGSAAIIGGSILDDRGQR